MNEQHKQLLEKVEIGEGAQKFLESELGKKIIDLADQERREALEDLATVNPKDELRIIELQLKAKFGERFAAWLVSLISEGENAISLYKQQRDD